MVRRCGEGVLGALTFVASPAFAAHSLPIYFGALVSVSLSLSLPPLSLLSDDDARAHPLWTHAARRVGASNVADFLPCEHCIVRVADFASTRALIEHVQMLMANETAYLEYFAWWRRPLLPRFMVRVCVCAVCASPRGESPVLTLARKIQSGARTLLRGQRHAEHRVHGVRACSQRVRAAALTAPRFVPGH
jgi:hypothetical protein